VATERRPYHLTADAVWHEPWDNDVYAFLGRLSAMMHERWRTSRLTAEEASTVLIGATDLQKIAGKRRLDVALTSARRAADVVTMFVERRGDVTEIRWPKWADFQRLASGHGGKRESTSSPSASSVQRPEVQTPKPPRETDAGGHRETRSSEPPDSPRKPPLAVARAWVAMCAAAREHGRQWRSDLGPGRAKLIERTLKGYPDRPDVCAAAVRGFAALSADWSEEIRDRCWKPEFILRSTKIDGHLDEDPGPAPVLPPAPEAPPAPAAPVPPMLPDPRTTVAAAVAAGRVGAFEACEARGNGHSAEFEEELRF